MIRVMADFHIGMTAFCSGRACKVKGAVEGFLLVRKRPILQNATGDPPACAARNDFIDRRLHGVAPRNAAMAAELLMIRSAASTAERVSNVSRSAAFKSMAFPELDAEKTRGS